MDLMCRLSLQPIDKQSPIEGLEQAKLYNILTTKLPETRKSL